MTGCGGMPGQEWEAQQPDPDPDDEGAAPAAQSIGHGSRNAKAAARFAPFTRSSPAGDPTGLRVPIYRFLTGSDSVVSLWPEAESAISGGNDAQTHYPNVARARCQAGWGPAGACWVGNRLFAVGGDRDGSFRHDAELHRSVRRLHWSSRRCREHRPVGWFARLQL